MEEKKRREEGQKKLIAQYKSVFGSDAGRAVLADLVDNNYIKASTVSKDLVIFGVREGQRNCVLRILAMIEADPETFMNQPQEEELSHVP